MTTTEGGIGVDGLLVIAIQCLEREECILEVLLAIEFRMTKLTRFKNTGTAKIGGPLQSWHCTAATVSARRARQIQETVLQIQEMALQMADPPPYVAYAAYASTESIPLLLTRHVSPNDYPKLCRVSSSWNKVFQPLLWSQPDRFFTTQQRSANSTPQTVKLMCSRVPKVHPRILRSPSQSHSLHHSSLLAQCLRVRLHISPYKLSLQTPHLVTTLKIPGLVPRIPHFKSTHHRRSNLPP
jgi:hypothetical protein